MIAAIYILASDIKSFEPFSGRRKICPSIVGNISLKLPNLNLDL